jgi:hypothetical protein
VVEQLTPAEFDDWLTIYRKRYSEIGAHPYPDAFHRSVYSIGVPAQLAEFWGVVDENADRLVGGVLFLKSADVVDYFSSAFDSNYRHLNPTVLLLDAAFQKFTAQSVRRLNWQSSAGREGVYTFKAHWGATESRHYYFSSLLKAESQLLLTPLEKVRELYPMRYVLPYSLWEDGGSDASEIK